MCRGCQPATMTCALLKLSTVRKSRLSSSGDLQAEPRPPDKLRPPTRLLLVRQGQLARRLAHHPLHHQRATSDVLPKDVIREPPESIQHVRQSQEQFLCLLRPINQATAMSRWRCRSSSAGKRHARLPRANAQIPCSVLNDAREQVKVFVFQAQDLTQIFHAQVVLLDLLKSSFAATTDLAGISQSSRHALNFFTHGCHAATPAGNGLPSFTSCRQEDPHAARNKATDWRDAVSHHACRSLLPGPCEP